MCCRVSLAYPPRAGCAHGMGDHNQNTDTWWCFTYRHIIQERHTYGGVTHMVYLTSCTYRSVPHMGFMHNGHQKHTQSELCTQLSCTDTPTLGNVCHTHLYISYILGCHMASLARWKSHMDGVSHTCMASLPGVTYISQTVSVIYGYHISNACSILHTHTGSLLETGSHTQCLLQTRSASQGPRHPRGVSD